MELGPQVSFPVDVGLYRSMTRALLTRVRTSEQRYARVLVGLFCHRNRSLLTLMRTSGMRYGGHELLRAKAVDGPAPPAGATAGAPVAFDLEALFDTGSSCVELPDSAVGGLEASPFRCVPSRMCSLV